MLVGRNVYKTQHRSGYFKKNVLPVSLCKVPFCCLFFLAFKQTFMQVEAQGSMDKSILKHVFFLAQTTNWPLAVHKSE